MQISNNDIRRGNVGPLQPGKEHASNRTNIDRKATLIERSTQIEKQTPR